MLHTIFLLLAGVPAFTRWMFPPFLATGGNKAMGPHKTSYTFEVQKKFTFSCSPCQMFFKGGTKKSLEDYAGAKANIDEILRRVQLAATEKGFMPHQSTRLSNDYINLLKQWKTDGLEED